MDRKIRLNLNLNAELSDAPTLDVCRSAPSLNHANARLLISMTSFSLRLPFDEADSGQQQEKNFVSHAPTSAFIGETKMKKLSQDATTKRNAKLFEMPSHPTLFVRGGSARVESQKKNGKTSAA